MALVDHILAAATVEYAPKRERPLAVALKNIAEMLEDDYAVFVGWFNDGNNYDTGEPVYEVAKVQEFGGTGDEGNNIPARPFIRPAMDNERQKWIDFIDNAIKAELGKGAKGDFARAFEKLGLMVQGDIQDYIHRVQNPPLAPLTLAKRAEKRGLTKEQTENMSTERYAVFSKPLEDTGQMISTVSYKVYKG